MKARLLLILAAFASMVLAGGAMQSIGPDA